MILGFKTKFPWGKPTHFPEKILAGIKIHTMRFDNNARWEEGRKIQFATGFRTKNYHQFASGIVKEKVSVIILPQIRSVRITWGSFLYGKPRILNDKEMEQFAINDGFDSVDDFFRWFKVQELLDLIIWDQPLLFDKKHLELIKKEM